MAPDEPRAAPLRVAVACSPRPGAAFEIELLVPAQATAWDAVRASGILDRWPGLVAGEPQLGIWGRIALPSAALREGDRVELYRSLTMDPQEARRSRVRKTGAGTRR